MSNTDEIKFNEMNERIERFLRGQMTPEEEAQLHEDLKNNPDLREHALAISALIKGLREKVRLQDQNIINEVTAHKKPKNLRRIIIWSSSIAAALVLVIGYNFYAENARYGRVNEMLSPYYEHYNLSALSRGETDSVTIAYLYNLFNRIQEEKDIRDIIAELEPIYNSLDSDFTYYPYANDIAWNLILAYIKDGQIDKAMALLEKLQNDSPGTPISVKAHELLIKLHDL